MPVTPPAASGPRAGLRRIALLVPTLALLMACDSNPFDASQIPQIRITPVIAAPLVTIAWTPAGAQQVVVYKGTVAAGGQPDLIVWSVTGSGQNSLVSSIEYGTTTPIGGAVDVPAKPLIPGQPYTVQVNRVDPKGGAIGGLTSAGARYQNTQTFTLAAVVTPP